MATKSGQTVKCNPQNQSKAAQGKASGKRRLDFGSQRFRGKSFFLDLRGYRQADDIERELLQRGAAIEEKFHQGVKYLVTCRPREHRKSQSPSTPSPNTPGTAKSTASQLVSPLTESPGSVEAKPKRTPAYQTRAQKVLQLSLEKQKNAKKVDIVAMAKEWGCKVVYLDELIAELKKLKPVIQNSKKVTFDALHTKVRTLRIPFFKVEDMCRAYRPLVYETSHWPHPDPNCSPRGGPFDSPKHAKSSTHAMKPPQQKPDYGNLGVGHTHPGGDHTHQGVGHAHQPAEPLEKRPGHCECCTVKFEDLHQHLRSAKHQEYAGNDANFTNIDSRIAQGTSFSDFIAGVRQKRKNAPRRIAAKSPGKSPTKGRKATVVVSRTVRRSPRKPAGARNSLTRDVVLLVTPPGSQISPVKPTSHEGMPKTPPKAVSKTPRKRSPVCPPKSPATPRTPRSSRSKRASPPSGPISPEKAIVLPENVSQKVGELCLVRVSLDSRGDPAMSTPKYGEMAPRPEYTPGFSTPVELLRADGRASTARLRGATPPSGLLPGLAIEQIAKRLIHNQGVGCSGSRKRLLESDGSSPSGSEIPAPKRLKADPEHLVLESLEQNEAGCSSSLPPGIRLVADHRLHEDIADELVPETPEKRFQAAARGDRRSPRAAALFNLESLIGKISSQTNSSASAAVARTPERGQKRTSSSPYQTLRKSPRLMERDRRRVQRSVTTRTELVRSFDCESLTVSYDLSVVSLKGNVQPHTPMNSAVAGVLSSDAIITPDISLQGPLFRADVESPLVGLGPVKPVMPDLSLSEGSSFNGFSPRCLQQSLPEFAMELRKKGAVEAEPKTSPLGSRCHRRSPRLQKGLELD